MCFAASVKRSMASGVGGYVFLGHLHEYNQNHGREQRPTSTQGQLHLSHTRRTAPLATMCARTRGRRIIVGIGRASIGAPTGAYAPALGRTVI